MTQAQIAVIGTGWWSTQTHIPTLLAHKDATLVAISDADPEKLQAAATAYAIEQCYEDYRAMLERETLDGVIVATSHASHYQITRDCLERGLHVLVEKPMTLYAADARALVELAAKQKRELIVGYPWNYTSTARRARELVTSGALGAEQFISCVFNSYNLDLFGGKDRSNQPAAYAVHGPGAVYSQPQLSGGGHGHLQMTHAVGLLFFTTSLRARRVTALMQNHGLAVDLVDAFTVEFQNGALGVVGGTSNAQPSKLDLQVYCANGYVDLDMIAATAHIRGPNGQQEAIRLIDQGERSYPSGATANNLVDCVLNRAPNHSPGEVGWRTVELLDAAYRSAAAGGQAVLVEDLYR